MNLLAHYSMSLRYLMESTSQPQNMTVFQENGLTHQRSSKGLVHGRKLSRSLVSMEEENGNIRLNKCFRISRKYGKNLVILLAKDRLPLLARRYLNLPTNT